MGKVLFDTQKEGSEEPGAWAGPPRVRVGMGWGHMTGKCHQGAEAMEVVAGAERQAAWDRQDNSNLQ